MRTAFWCLFLFHMRCRKLQAQHRFREVPWSTDLAPSSTTGRVQLNWTFSFPREALYQLWQLWVRQQPDNFRIADDPDRNVALGCKLGHPYASLGEEESEFRVPTSLSMRERNDAEV